MKTQKLQFALQVSMIHKKYQKQIKNTFDSDNKSEQKNTNICI